MMKLQTTGIECKSGTTFYVAMTENDKVLLVVRKVARHVVVIDTGRVGYEGEAAELLGDEPLVRRLLGVA